MCTPPKRKLKPTHRSAITNGTNLLPAVDHRIKWMRRLRDIVQMYVADFGGEDNVSTAEMSLIRRAATLTVELEKMEALFATDGGASPDLLDLYGRSAGNLRRCLETIGIKRRPRDVTTLAEHIRQNSETT